MVFVFGVCDEDSIGLEHKDYQSEVLERYKN